MNNERLLARLSMLDFAATDLALYLNTHPDDKKMIEQYNQIIDEADKLRYIYETTVSPLYSYRSSSKEDYFGWIDNPWPQDYCFNFDVSGNIPMPRGNNNSSCRSKNDCV